MPKSHVSKKNRELVFVRANGRCEYCQSRSDVALESFEIEHIIPVSKGGPQNLSNFALSCRGCNSRKAISTQGKDPLTNDIINLFHPRKDKWKTHFEWSDDFLTMIGKTPTGRATIQVLQLNRIGVINLRNLMVLGKIHPPLETL